MQEPNQDTTPTAVSFCLMIVIVFLAVALKLEAQRNLELPAERGPLETFADVP